MRFGSEETANGGFQRRRFDRFREHLVDAGPPNVGLGDAGSVAAHQQDGPCEAVVAERARQLQTVHSGHLEVGNQQIEVRGGGLERLECGPGSGARRNVMTQAAQANGLQLQDAALVIYNQDMGRHRTLGIEMCRTAVL